MPIFRPNQLLIILLSLSFLGLTACRNGISEITPGPEPSVKSTVTDLQAPSNTTTEALSDSSILLKWESPAITDEFDIAIEVKELGSDDLTYREVAVVRDVEQQVVIGLVEDTHYEFRLYAFTASKISDYDVTIGNTLEAGGSNAPQAVTAMDLQLTRNVLGDYEYTLSFDHPDIARVDFFTVKKTLSGSSAQSAVYTFLVTENTTTSGFEIKDNGQNALFIDSGVYLASQNNTTHNYEVKACNRSACSTPITDYHRIQTVGTTKPAIINFAASDQQDDQVTVTWGFSTGSMNLVSSARLIRSQPNVPGSVVSIYSWPMFNVPIRTSFIDGTTVNGQIYDYTLTLNYTSGPPESATDQGQSKTPPPNTMKKADVTSVSVDYYEPGETQVDYSWTHDDRASLGYANFIVQSERKRKGQAWSSATVVALDLTQSTQSAGKYGHGNALAQCDNATYQEYDMRISVITKDPNNIKADSDPAYSNTFSCYSHAKKPSLSVIRFSTGTQLQQFLDANATVFYPQKSKHLSFNGLEVQWSSKRIISNFWLPAGNGTVNGTSPYITQSLGICLAASGSSPTHEVKVQVRAKSTVSGKHSDWVETTADCL